MTEYLQALALAASLLATNGYPLDGMQIRPYDFGPINRAEHRNIQELACNVHAREWCDYYGFPQGTILIGVEALQAASRGEWAVANLAEGLNHEHRHVLYPDEPHRVTYQRACEAAHGVTFCARPHVQARWKG